MKTYAASATASSKLFALVSKYMRPKNVAWIDSIGSNATEIAIRLFIIAESES